MTATWTGTTAASSSSGTACSVPSSPRTTASPVSTARAACCKAGIRCGPTPWCTGNSSMTAGMRGAVATSCASGSSRPDGALPMWRSAFPGRPSTWTRTACSTRSEEHTSELQSQSNLVCRLLLEKKDHTYELQSQSNIVCRLLLEKKEITMNFEYSINCFILTVEHSIMTIELSDMMYLIHNLQMI